MRTWITDGILQVAIGTDDISYSRGRVDEFRKISAICRLQKIEERPIFYFSIFQFFHLSIFQLITCSFFAFFSSLYFSII